MTNVHVGIQLGREPARLEFGGPAVHRRPGERSVYPTWGEVSSDNDVEMFRQAKRMLNRIDASVVGPALDAQPLLAIFDLTGGDGDGDGGGARCARVDPPAIEWSVPPL